MQHQQSRTITTRLGNVELRHLWLKSLSSPSLLSLSSPLLAMASASTSASAWVSGFEAEASPRRRSHSYSRRIAFRVCLALGSHSGSCCSHCCCGRQQRQPNMCVYVNVHMWRRLSPVSSYNRKFATKKVF